MRRAAPLIALAALALGCSEGPGDGPGGQPASRGAPSEEAPAEPEVGFADLWFLRGFSASLVRPRNRDPGPPHAEGVDARLSVPVGGGPLPQGAPFGAAVPEATLDVWVFEPEGGAAPDAVDTAVLLHGVGDQKTSMASLGRRLARRGIRAVAVDLRGHGRSSGEHIGYGAFEARDLSQVLDTLAARDYEVGEVGVYATSYGAHVALVWAGLEPRVDRVLTVGAYRSLRALVPEYLRARHLERADLPARVLGAAVDAAGERAGFDPDLASAEAAIGRSEARVLLVHGTADDVIPIDHAEALQRACGPRCRLLRLEGEGHLSSMSGPALRAAIYAWLDGRFDAVEGG